MGLNHWAVPEAPSLHWPGSDPPWSSSWPSSALRGQRSTCCSLCEHTRLQLTLQPEPWEWRRRSGGPTCAPESSIWAAPPPASPPSPPSADWASRGNLLGRLGLTHQRQHTDGKTPASVFGLNRHNSAFILSLWIFTFVAQTPLFESFSQNNEQTIRIQAAELNKRLQCYTCWFETTFWVVLQMWLDLFHKLGTSSENRSESYFDTRQGIWTRDLTTTGSASLICATTPRLKTTFRIKFHSTLFKSTHVQVVD